MWNWVKKTNTNKQELNLELNENVEMPRISILKAPSPHFNADFHRAQITEDLHGMIQEFLKVFCCCFHVP